MILVCIFVPFLHDETPQPLHIVKVAESKNSNSELATKIKMLLESRNRISEA
jgi:hypothetical protein